MFRKPDLPQGPTYNNIINYFVQISDKIHKTRIDIKHKNCKTRYAT